MEYDQTFHISFVADIDHKFSGLLVECLDMSENKQSVREGSEFTFLRQYRLSFDKFNPLVLPLLKAKLIELRQQTDAYRAKQPRKEPEATIIDLSEDDYYTDVHINNIINVS